jgi:hypothetical protein
MPPSEASTRRAIKRMMDETGGLQFSYWNITNAAEELRKTRLNVDRQNRASRSNATPGFAVCGFLCVQFSDDRQA